MGVSIQPTKSSQLLEGSEFCGLFGPVLKRPAGKRWRDATLPLHPTPNWFREDRSKTFRSEGVCTTLLGLYPWKMTQNRSTVLSGNVPKWGQYPVGVFPGCSIVGFVPRPNPQAPCVKKSINFVADPNVHHPQPSRLWQSRVQGRPAQPLQIRQSLRASPGFVKMMGCLVLSL